MAETMTQTHQRLLEYLLTRHKEDSDFCFTLRRTNRSQRLSKGYWFLGNENYLAVSFWTGNDWKNKTPNIYFRIHKNGTQLNLSAKDSELKAEFFEKLTRFIPGFKRRKSQGEYINFWSKYYSTSGEVDYLEALHEFLEQDKQQIDAFISLAGMNEKQLDNIGFIGKEEFDDSLKRIEKYLRKRSSLGVDIQQLSDEFEAAHMQMPVVLKRLELSNIQHLQFINVDLSRRINCIIGENGIGKTSILRAIALALVGVTETSIDMENNRLKNFLSIEAVNERGNVYAEMGRIALQYQISDTSHTNIIEFKGRDNFVDNIEDIGDEDSFLAAKGDYLNTLTIGFPQVQTKSGDPTFEALPLHKDRPNLNDLLPLIYDTPDNRLHNFEDWLIDLYNTTNKKLVEQAKAPEKRIIELVFEIISELTGTQVRFKDIKIDSREIFITTQENPAGIPLDLVSQGFNKVFSWVGFLMMRLAETAGPIDDFTRLPAIVLIDEIDTYLHIKWQRSILNILADKFPKIQFVVTTHSPFVLQAVDDMNIILLSGEQQVVVAQMNPIDITNWRVDQILTSRLFGIGGLRSIRVERLMKEKTRLLEQTELSPTDETRLQEIEDELGYLPTATVQQDIEVMALLRQAADKLRAFES